MPYPDAKRLLWYLFAGSRGGENRIRIIGAILIVLGILVLTNQLSIIGNFPLANEIINFGKGLTT